MGNFLVWVVWIVAAFACLGSGVAVVSFSNPFYSALALIGNLGSLAVLYLLLSAEFVAAAQVLIYAGAVMVMFLFVIAYLGGRADAPWAGGPSWQTIGAVGAAGALLVEIIVAIGLKAGGSLAPAKVYDSFGSPSAVGRAFLTDHLLAFEITSIVLLVAAVGGVVLGSYARRPQWGSDRPRSCRARRPQWGSDRPRSGPSAKRPGGGGLGEPGGSPSRPGGAA